MCRGAGVAGIAPQKHRQLPSWYELLAPVAISGLADTHAATGRSHVAGIRPRPLNLEQKPEYDPVRMSLPSHQIAPQPLKVTARF